MSRTAGAPVVVVGVDGSTHDAPPMQHAAQEAALRGAVLRVVHAYQVPARSPGRSDVAPSSQGLGEAEEQAWQVGRRALAGVQAQVPRSEVRCGQGPAADVLEAIADAVLLVVGMHGRGGMDRLLGSTSSSVVRRASLPVTVVPVPSGGMPPAGASAAAVAATAASAGPDRNEDRFYRYPRGVGSWGCCPGAAGVEQTLQAGVDVSTVRVLSGARRAGLLDRAGTGHGAARAAGAAVAAGRVRGRHVARPRVGIAGGWHLVYVPVHGDEQDRAVRDVLRGTGGRYLLRFGRWSIEQL